LRAADDRSRFPVEAVLHEASIQTRGAEPADGDPPDAVRCGDVRHCHSGQHHRVWRDRLQASAAWRLVVDLKTSNPGNHFNIMPTRFGLSCISLPKSGHVSEPPESGPIVAAKLPVSSAIRRKSENGVLAGVFSRRS
jgi:hypothetical protein